MYKFEERTVEISMLRPCPVKVTLQTGKLFADLAAIAKSHPERIEPIMVAQLGNLSYIVNGHLRVQALRAAGKSDVPAHIVKVSDMPEIVRLHMEHNMHGSISPLGMLDAAEFLKKHGAPNSVPKAYLELAQKSLYPSVRSQLERFLAEACKKYSSVEMPFYVIKWIVSFEGEKEQALATSEVLDVLRHAKESRFVFPTPDDLDVISHSLLPSNLQQKGVILFEPGKKARGLPRIQKKEGENLVRGSAHNSIVQCACGKKLLLNTKTSRVSSVRNDAKNGCIKLDEERNSRPVYAIPDAAIEFLQAEGDGLRLVKIGSKKELARFVSEVGDSVRMIVLTAR